MKRFRSWVPAVLLSSSVLIGCSEEHAPDAPADESTTQNLIVQPNSSPPSDREIRVSIDSDGRYTVEGQECDSNLLEDRFRSLMGTAKNPSVHVSCGSDSEFKLVQQVIDPAMRLQMWTIRLQTSPDQEPADLSRTCAGPWHIPVLHIRVFPQRLTVNGVESNLSSLDALLRNNPEGSECVAFVRPQEGAKVGQVYSVLRTCATNAVEFGLFAEDDDLLATERVP